MANKSVYTNLTAEGAVSRINNFSDNVILTQAALLLQTFPALGADGKATNIAYTAIDTKKTWRWLGGQTNNDSTSAGVGTSWFENAKEEKEIIVLANPPIDTWSDDVYVLGVAPTGMTEATNQFLYLDASGKIHLYSVTDPLGTPVIKEITTNELMQIKDDSLIDEASVLALAPLRLHTIYFNSDTGQKWLVDENGGILTLTNRFNYGEIEFNPVTLVALTPYLFRINDDATILIQDGAVAKPVTREKAMTANSLLRGVAMLDADNGLQLNTSSYKLTPLDKERFEIEVNFDCTVIGSYGGLLQTEM